MIINNHNWTDLKQQFLNAKPFNHIVIDNFFTDEFASAVANEFPAYDSDKWIYYHNAIEDKKTCNHWDSFPKNTYRAFNFLVNDFVGIVQNLVDDPQIQADQGLHGGGWHAHSTGGKNNVHLDYSIHPKLGLQRKVNIIVYMTPSWKPEWNGELEIWDHNTETGLPGNLVDSVENKFNRAVIFNTTQNSWHGLPKEITCPAGVARQSLAVYYVTKPAEVADPRVKALFAPYGDQVNDPAIMELIKQRSTPGQAETVYRK